jgi:hypothetical protein
MGNASRREFLGATGTAVLGGAAANAIDSRSAQEESPKSLQPQSLLKGTAALCRPVLGTSQLGFRLGLARTRTAAYPLDSLDFIMIDLERPEGSSRHASWCTGDLTGRLLEFLSISEGVDGKSDPRLGALFERILKQRRPSGLFSRFHDRSGGPPEGHFLAGSGRLFPGLVRYHELTGDSRALDAATGLAARLWSVRDAWRKHLQATSCRVIEAWVSEPFARLSAIDPDPRWLQFCGMIRDYLGPCDVPCHSHGYQSTLRGLQAASLLTGDLSWNEKPERMRRMIIERHFETADGCICESFPHSSRNEGCSIADWLILNLNAGLILDDDAAYDKAEHVFWNALSFNQWITGCFGHRALTSFGYGMPLEEAWWCCVHEAGMAMSEMARHVVTARNGTLRVNFLITGRYTVPLHGGKEAVITIVTDYPAKAEATINVAGAPASMPVRVRVPGCVRGATVSKAQDGQNARITFKGRLGHRIEPWGPGVVLTYGPLILVPASYGFGSEKLTEADRKAPAGYVPDSLPSGVPAILPGCSPDADGFLALEPGPLPDWSYWDEGPRSRTSVAGASVTVPARLADNKTAPLRFTPMTYNTSCLTLCETPVVLRKG